MNKNVRKQAVTSPELVTLQNAKPEQLLRNLHSFEGKIAERITNFAGSMQFAYFHTIWFGFWILINYGLFKPFIPVFDPFPYGLLTMIVSLEAIFLSTFIMVAQNRQVLVDTYRELEEEKEQKEEEKEQEELEKDVDEMQQDLDDIKNAMNTIQQKLMNVEKLRGTNQTVPTPPKTIA